MADQQQAIFDAINSASKKGRGGLGYDGPKKRAKVVEESDGLEDTVKAVVTAGDAADDADYGFADGGFDEVPHSSGPTGSDTNMEGFSRSGPSHNSRMHPRNEYRNRRPNFAALAARHPSFAPFVKHGKGGEPCIDWKDAYAVRELTTVLLKDDFGLHWELPINHLCPPLPNRLNYIHWMEDLLRQRLPDAFPDMKVGADVTGVDIGTGASVIYPLLGNTVYGWKFVATEIDPESVTLAEANVARNHLSHKISVLPVAAGSYFLPVIAAHPSVPVFEFCMCNPPFFADVSEACSHPEHGTAGTSTELATAGGEVAFVKGMIAESGVSREKIIWYSTMVGKKATLTEAAAALEDLNVTCIRTTTFFQGKTVRWGLAWSYYPSDYFTTHTALTTPEEAEKHSKQFNVDGIDPAEVGSRVSQCLTEKLIVHTQETKESSIVWKCIGDHLPKPPAEGEVAPMNNNLDNSYRFTVHLTVTGPSTVSVVVKFVSGLNRTMESFWRIADCVEGDVRRTNRAWRRRLAKSSEAAPSTKE